MVRGWDVRIVSSCFAGASDVHVMGGAMVQSEGSSSGRD
jgi:hypothetical protein